MLQCLICEQLSIHLFTFQYNDSDSDKDFGIKRKWKLWEIPRCVWTAFLNPVHDLLQHIFHFFVNSLRSFFATFPKMFFLAKHYQILSSPLRAQYKEQKNAQYMFVRARLKVNEYWLTSATLIFLRYTWRMTKILFCLLTTSLWSVDFEAVIVCFPFLHLKVLSNQTHLINNFPDKYIKLA